MIHIDDAGIHIEGTSTVLLAELTTVMNLIIKKNIANAEMLHECLDLATLSDEERKKQAEQLMTDMMCSMFGLPKMPPSQFNNMMKVVDDILKERSKKDE